VASAGMLLLAPFILRFVFGLAFAGAMRPFLLLLPGTIAGSLTSSLGLYFIQQLGKPRINALFSAAGLSLNVVLNILWIPAYGPAGAALSSSISYSLVAVLLILLFRREPGFSWRGLLIPGRADRQLVAEGWRLISRRS